MSLGRKTKKTTVKSGIWHVTNLDFYRFLPECECERERERERERAYRDRIYSASQY